MIISIFAISALAVGIETVTLDDGLLLFAIERADGSSLLTNVSDPFEVPGLVEPDGGPELLHTLPGRLPMQRLVVGAAALLMPDPAASPSPSPTHRHEGTGPFRIRLRGRRHHTSITLLQTNFVGILRWAKHALPY